jgi:hypothetical protein
MVLLALHAGRALVHAPVVQYLASDWYRLFNTTDNLFELANILDILVTAAKLAVRRLRWAQELLDRIIARLLLACRRVSSDHFDGILQLDCLLSRAVDLVLEALIELNHLLLDVSSVFVFASRIGQLYLRFLQFCRGGDRLTKVRLPLTADRSHAYLRGHSTDCVPRNLLCSLDLRQ